MSYDGRFHLSQRTEFRRIEIQLRHPTHGWIQHVIHTDRVRFLAPGDYQLIVRPVPPRTKLYERIRTFAWKWIDALAAWVLNEPAEPPPKDKK